MYANAVLKVLMPSIGSTGAEGQQAEWEGRLGGTGTSTAAPQPPRHANPAGRSHQVPGPAGPRVDSGTGEQHPLRLAVENASINSTHLGNASKACVCHLLSSVCCIA